MRNLMKFCFLIYPVVLSFGAKADHYRNFLWGLDVLPSPTSVQLSFDDYTSSAYGEIKGLGGLFAGTVLAADCKGEDLDHVKARGAKTNWVLLPEEYTYGGINFTISKIAPPWRRIDDVPIPTGYTAWIVQTETSDWWLGVCHPVGEKYPAVEITWNNLSFALSIERRNAVPGHYDIQIPFYYGFEEYKLLEGVGGYVAKNAPNLIYLLTKPQYIPVSVDIRSKCHFNSSPINLSHGVMTGVNADGNQTRPYNLDISCTPGTSLSAKFIGTQRISGRTDNYTRCGDSGMCELTFDNGKHDESMIIDNTKTLSIKSTYHLNEPTKVIAESFEGSAVLQVLVR
ncbi:hypothetical protein HEK73_024005 [Escherichia coli]|uniref:hypothetical protein n=1 Tax=Escherichia coli TaxID=562 RepID=UPI000BE813FC|nr:hypothetical protein [Escherichia coli]MBB8471474.1 hypothetical protein [Escherichia coli]